MTALDLTAIVCTHNPSYDYLDETLGSIRTQAPLSGEREWELLVIDNKSLDPITTRVDLSWHPNARVVREDRIGLTYARIRGFQEARGDILVYIDDDNVLNPNYLRVVVCAFDAQPKVGAVGGRVIPDTRFCHRRGFRDSESRWPVAILATRQSSPIGEVSGRPIAPILSALLSARAWEFAGALALAMLSPPCETRFELASAVGASISRQAKTTT